MEDPAAQVPVTRNWYGCARAGAADHNRTKRRSPNVVVKVLLNITHLLCRSIPWARVTGCRYNVAAKLRYESLERSSAPSQLAT